MRLCHLSDVHLGYRRYHRVNKSGFNQREVDVSLAFREAVDRVIALAPDLTIIAGDLFHTVRPSNAVLAFAFRELRRLAEGTRAPVVLIGGNHDTPRRSDSGSPLRIFAEIDGMHVADLRAERFSFPDRGVSVQCLPHGYLTSGDVDRPRADDRFRCNILAAHLQVRGRWVSEFGGVELPIEHLSPHEWDYLALGHVHVFERVLANAAYSGSLEHTAASIWSEAGVNKGFLEVELPARKFTFHALTTPREIVVLEPVAATGLEPEAVSAAIDTALRGPAGGLEGKLIKLSVIGIPREIVRHLDQRMLRRWRSAALHLSIDFVPPEFAGAAPSGLQVPRGPLAAELDTFCLAQSGGSVPPAEIVALFGEYVKRLEAADEAR